ncbi:hypothetical protein JTE90_026210 [Oedothorax gibbosus]|uniref:Serpin domain-containing protein n=1 Tax=Oedothorax gibbosus TaxID=931172 RepID=A0AAV6U1K6_9ARAC|nr:hypothetical protein JTE90_026210 [Oedothorax gibbosus]
MVDQVTDKSISPEILALSEANNYLAVNLHKELAKEGQNVFFSPFSISTALAMLFCGSRSETAAEMRQVLGYQAANIKDEDLKTSFEYLLAAIEKSPDSYILACANSVLSQKDFSVKDEYKSLLVESFKALLEEVDFARESGVAVKKVNGWVGEKTNNMITNLLDSLDPSTVMVLVNAVYFKGSWKEQFNERETFLQYFYNNGDGENHKQVDMMHLKKEFNYAEKDSYKALELPYKGEEISMLILLPNDRNGLQDLEKSLNPNFIQDLKSSMRNTKVEVALPKFKMEYSKALKETFQKLGMNRLFQRGAHFGGISDSNELLISEVIHKAVLEVNEEGSEAAAATAVVMMLCSLQFDPEFIVDHPFLFVIYNSKNNMIWFMGRVDEL